MEAPKNIEHQIGGIQNDTLRYGLNSVKSNLVGSHPVESAHQSTKKMQEEMERRILANTYGIAFPMRMDFERQMLSRFHLQAYLSLSVNTEESSYGCKTAGSFDLWQKLQKKAGLYIWIACCTQLIHRDALILIFLVRRYSSQLSLKQHLKSNQLPT